MSRSAPSASSPPSSSATGATSSRSAAPTAVLPLLWEFPGGRVEAGETDAHALKREVLHRLGVEIEVGKLISFVSHPYEHYVVDLFLYECTLVGDDARAARRERVQVGRRAPSSISTRSRPPTRRR